MGLGSVVADDVQHPRVLAFPSAVLSALILHSDPAVPRSVPTTRRIREDDGPDCGRIPAFLPCSPRRHDAHGKEKLE